MVLLLILALYIFILGQLLDLVFLVASRTVLLLLVVVVLVVVRAITSNS